MGNQQIENYEEWRSCNGYCNTEVSNLGNVRCSKSKKSKNQHLCKHGYLHVWLVNEYDEWKKVRVHRLVTKEFIENPHNKPEVNHIDCDKQNNVVSNLEWATSKENKQHALKNNLYKVGDEAHNACHDEYTIRQVCDLMVSEPSNIKVSDATGVSVDIVAHIRSGDIWKHISDQYCFTKKQVKSKKAEEVLAVADSIVSGKSVKEISEMHNVSGAEVRRIWNKSIFKDLLSGFDFPENRNKKISDEKVHTICNLLQKSEYTITEICKMTDTTRSVVGKIKNKKSHKEISDLYVF